MQQCEGFPCRAVGVCLEDIKWPAHASAPLKSPYHRFGLQHMPFFELTQSQELHSWEPSIPEFVLQSQHLQSVTGVASTSTQCMGLVPSLSQGWMSLQHSSDQPRLPGSDQSWTDMGDMAKVTRGTLNSSHLSSPAPAKTLQYLLTFCLSKESEQLLWNSFSVKRRELGSSSKPRGPFYNSHIITAFKYIYLRNSDLTLKFEKATAWGTDWCVLSSAGQTKIKWFGTAIGWCLSLQAPLKQNYLNLLNQSSRSAHDVCSIYVTMYTLESYMWLKMAWLYITFKR